MALLIGQRLQLLINALLQLLACAQRLADPMHG
jgi:hypothetical protein